MSLNPNSSPAVFKLARSGRCWQLGRGGRAASGTWGMGELLQASVKAHMQQNTFKNNEYGDNARCEDKVST